MIEMAGSPRWTIALQAVAVLVTVLPSVCAAPPTASPVAGTPVTVNFNQFQLGSNDLPLSDQLLAPSGGEDTPEQVHIGLGSGPSEMYITWITNAARLSATAPQAPPANLISQVVYGIVPGKYNANATGASTYYVQNNTGKALDKDDTLYVSGRIHTVLLKDLEPNTTYYYRVGDFASNADNATSLEYSFKTGLPVGPSSFPQTIGVVADVGLTSNSTVTLTGLMANQPEMVLFVGDLIYADDYNADGKSAYDYPAIKEAGSPDLHVNKSSYQPRWDGFGRAMQRIANTTTIPFMYTTGNHEIEMDSSKKTFQSFLARYPAPYKQSNSTNPLYYSFDYGGAHYVQIAAYEGPGPRGVSRQYKYPNGNYPHTVISPTQLAWLEADLAAVNRTRTPWIIAQTHPPYYNTYNQHYKEVQCFQHQVEPLLYKYGVNFAFFGHVHAYERMWPVFNYKLDPCAPVSITIGDGGNVEGTYKVYIDTPPYIANCSVPLSKLNAPGNYTPLCATAEVYSPGQEPTYCPTAQPFYSAYREPSFGHGILKLLSPTEATWSWHRNQDSVLRVTDEVTVVRNSSCPNQALAAQLALSGAPAPAPSAADAG